jgi:RNA polymerase sigma factor (sigma-70 family)
MENASAKGRQREPARADRRAASLSARALSEAEAERLFRDHGDGLVRAIRRRLRCGDALAEDACAFAWLQLWRTRPASRERIFGWLYVVALHEGLRLLRACARELSAEDRPGTDGYAASSLEQRIADPHTTELSIEARDALHALASLKPRQRGALTLKAAGYSYREIADLLGVTYTYVNRHLTEGRRAVRELRDAASLQDGFEGA